MVIYLFMFKRFEFFFFNSRTQKHTHVTTLSQIRELFLLNFIYFVCSFLKRVLEAGSIKAKEEKKKRIILKLFKLFFFLIE